MPLSKVNMRFKYVSNGFCLGLLAARFMNVFSLKNVFILNILSLSFNVTSTKNSFQAQKRFFLSYEHQNGKIISYSKYEKFREQLCRNVRTFRVFSRVFFTVSTTHSAPLGFLTPAKKSMDFFTFIM